MNFINPKNAEKTEKIITDKRTEIVTFVCFSKVKELFQVYGSASELQNKLFYASFVFIQQLAKYLHS